LYKEASALFLNYLISIFVGACQISLGGSVIAPCVCLQSGLVSVVVYEVQGEGQFSYHVQVKKALVDSAAA